MNKDNTTVILHLSDLHFGEGSVSDTEWKVFIDDATRITRRERLKIYINSLPFTPHFVIISGDICIGCHEDGFEQFTELFKELIKEKKLPNPENIIIVPGNHDVDRKQVGNPRERFALFYKHVGQYYVRPWLKGYDENPDQVIDELKQRLIASPKIIGGIRRDGDPLLQKCFSLPFKFDLNRKIFIYAFNSAAISGTRKSIPEEIKVFINSLKIKRKDDQEVIKILNCLEEEFQIDPARIEPDERSIFYQVTEILEHTYGKDKFKEFIKIAAFHHNIVPFVNEEVKPFDLMTNAGQIKKELVEAGFQMVLHGHKHHPEILLDTAISGGGCLNIISGNTIGGGQASKLYPGFNIINWNADESVISVQSIQLSDTGSPRKGIEGAEIKQIHLLDRELKEDIKKQESDKDNVRELNEDTKKQESDKDNVRELNEDTKKQGNDKDNVSEIISKTTYLQDVNLENINNIYKMEQKKLKKEFSLEIFDKACELFKNNKWEEAVKYFNKLIEFDPEFQDGNCNVSDSRGYAPLHLAVIENNEKLLRFFLANKVDINSREGTLSTPLHLAAHRNHEKLVELLINNKAAINVQNKGGDTPLHLAIYTKSSESIKILLKYGVDLDIENNKRNTPLNLAEQEKVKPEIIELIRKLTQRLTQRGLVKKNFIVPDMALIPRGTFQMRDINKKYIYSVTISSFYIGKYEVTNSEYVLFLNSQGNQIEEGVTWIHIVSDQYQGITGGPNPETFSIVPGYENRPVVYVSWYGAVAYCNWLSSQQGLTLCYGPINDRGNDPSVWRTLSGYRLPTETEWEYACRAGETSEYYWGDPVSSSSDPPNIGNYVWYSGNSGDNHHIVGLLGANNFGLYDMLGNVLEWCNDWYSVERYRYEKPSEYYDPTGPTSGKDRILRGTPWNISARHCLVSRCVLTVPTNQCKTHGFRMVRK